MRTFALVLCLPTASGLLATTVAAARPVVPLRASAHPLCGQPLPLSGLQARLLDAILPTGSLARGAVDAIELRVATGERLTLVATHNAHDVDHVTLHGVSESMLANSVGHHEFLDTPIGAKLGVTLSKRPFAPGAAR